jgi:hypothetical protein
VFSISTRAAERYSAHCWTAAQFKGKARAIEPYPPNVTVARETLTPLSVKVIDNSADAAELGDQKFDLMISRHGGSLSPANIAQRLKPGGRFISEQIGDRTNQELHEIFGSGSTSSDEWPHNAGDARQVFAEESLGLEAHAAAHAAHAAHIGHAATAGRTLVFRAFGNHAASVVISRPATEAASCSAVRTTLVGSITPADTRFS